MRIVELQITMSDQVDNLVKFVKKLRFRMRCIVFCYFCVTLLNMMFQVIYYQNKKDYSEGWQLAVKILDVIFSILFVIPWQLFKVAL